MTNRLVIANWKMNGDLAFAKVLVSSLPSTSNVQTVLVPPAVYAHHLVELPEGTYESACKMWADKDRSAYRGVIG